MNCLIIGARASVAKPIVEIFNANDYNDFGFEGAKYEA